MELGSLIGFFGGIIIVTVSLFISANWIAADVLTFWSLPSLLITVGGSFAATFFANKFNLLITAFKAVGVVFKPPALNPTETINLLVLLANTARREGVLSLEDSAMYTDDIFLQKGIMLVVDGTDPDLVKTILESELSCIDERHSDIASVYEFIASQGPAWGMVGTLVGLILMLVKMEDPSSLGPSMSVALITTFYGSLLANLLATPIAHKMQQINKEELMMKSVMIEGLLAIQAGENPRIIEEKLKSFLSPGLRERIRFKEEVWEE